MKKLDIQYPFLLNAQTIAKTDEGLLIEFPPVQCSMKEILSVYETQELPFAMPSLKFFFAEMLLAVHTLKTNKICHPTLSPSTVFLDKDGSLRVAFISKETLVAIPTLLSDGDESAAAYYRRQEQMDIIGIASIIGQLTTMMQSTKDLLSNTKNSDVTVSNMDVEELDGQCELLNLLQSLLTIDEDNNPTAFDLLQEPLFQLVIVSIRHKVLAEMQSALESIEKENEIIETISSEKKMKELLQMSEIVNSVMKETIRRMSIEEQKAADALDEGDRKEDANEKKEEAKESSAKQDSNNEQPPIEDDEKADPEQDWNNLEVDYEMAEALMGMCEMDQLLLMNTMKPDAATLTPLKMRFLLTCLSENGLDFHSNSTDASEQAEALSTSPGSQPSSASSASSASSDSAAASCEGAADKRASALTFTYRALECLSTFALFPSAVFVTAVLQRGLLLILDALPKVPSLIRQKMIRLLGDFLKIEPIREGMMSVDWDVVILALLRLDGECAGAIAYWYEAYVEVVLVNANSGEEEEEGEEEGGEDDDEEDDEEDVEGKIEEESDDDRNESSKKGKKQKKKRLPCVEKKRREAFKKVTEIATKLKQTGAVEIFEGYFKTLVEKNKEIEKEKENDKEKEKEKNEKKKAENEKDADEAAKKTEEDAKDKKEDQIKEFIRDEENYKTASALRNVSQLLCVLHCILGDSSIREYLSIIESNFFTAHTIDIRIVAALYRQYRDNADLRLFFNSISDPQRLCILISTLSGIPQCLALKSTAELARALPLLLPQKLLQCGILSSISPLLRAKSDDNVLFAAAQLLSLLLDAEPMEFIRCTDELTVASLVSVALTHPSPSAAVAFFPLITALLRQAPHLFLPVYHPPLVEIINRFLPAFADQPARSSHPLLLVIIESGKQAEFLAPHPLKEQIETNGLLGYLTSQLALTSASSSASSSHSDSGRIFKLLCLLALHKAQLLPERFRICLAALEPLIGAETSMFRRIGIYIILFLAEAKENHRILLEHNLVRLSVGLLDDEDPVVRLCALQVVHVFMLFKEEGVPKSIEESNAAILLLKLKLRQDSESVNSLADRIIAELAGRTAQKGIAVVDKMDEDDNRTEKKDESGNDGTTSASSREYEEDDGK
ncbi:uncharacterized protein MONOS_5180 [Monocercomonoides exilis]|uniref:uncharacterized protein n=1 Tax=Monocercomonoides exilis TaxID=2049356 RepID=UPI0035596EC7|nr:hypothetical protein MONOS_5180 [Monocercomonoides exilis]|eukprot:MONOS_5180.1-p1 / transcript=MONOS_5180.1 / gene=MONOS_5180 / organism=Monocercomonoides_exilis_PA203 / gene_product=unspecified product / transcript_product=unspecified product / location=Mono_scaffold00148:33455-37641(+) / protein_length=1129 / sequence_SO=supercontig / SO=protein_coding / is_pseudo=false